MKRGIDITVRQVVRYASGGTHPADGVSAFTGMTQKMARAFVGTSGFMYDHWGGGVFYPVRLPRRRWLEFYTEHFDTVELNVAFYRLPSEETFRSWYRRTPADFTFALKGSRFITHIKRLKECGDPLRLYLRRGRLLREKLSVVLWQLPPRFTKDVSRLEDFVRILRRYRLTRHAFEFRDETWFHDDVYEVLNKADIALCMADRPRYDVEIPETADFIYLRRHGPESGQLYTGCYLRKDLNRDVRDIKKWLSAGKDVYIYFNNDAHGWAVKNAAYVKKSIERSLRG